MRRRKKVIFLRDHTLAEGTTAKSKHKNKSHSEQRVDTDPQDSQYTGLKGFYERTFRRFKTFGYLCTIAPLYALGGLFLGLALAPGLYIFHSVNEAVQTQPLVLQCLAQGLALGVGFFAFGFCLILIVPLSNFLLRTRPGIFRGPYYSVDFLKWFVHNSLTYLVRYTFLEFITPTPFNLLFFKLMGMKIGKATQINSSNISDPALITLGDRVTIGGSATLCAHYGQGGYLVLAPIVIGNGVTVGLKASVMGGVEIGDNAKILPHSIVLPKTKIPANETWGGIPAVKIEQAGP